MISSSATESVLLFTPVYRIRRSSGNSWQPRRNDTARAKQIQTDLAVRGLCIPAAWTANSESLPQLAHRAATTLADTQSMQR